MPLDLETRDQLIASVRRFVTERLVPAEDQTARDDLVPEAIVAEMRELGLFGISIPTEYGGLGLTMRSYGRALMLIGSVHPAFGAMLSAHQSIGVPTPLKLFGISGFRKPRKSVAEAEPVEYCNSLLGGAGNRNALIERSGAVLRAEVGDP